MGLKNITRFVSFDYLILLLYFLIPFIGFNITIYILVVTLIFTLNQLKSRSKYKHILLCSIPFC